MKVHLPELFWYENSTVELELPDDWDVQPLPMRGAQRPALSLEQIAEAINDPIDSPRIRDLARGKKKAVIIFDDMTRPTRVDQIAPTIIGELLEGGVSEENISFVCALGTHGALTQHELRRKVGARILERFRVYNHNCYENCVAVGTTKRGTKLEINREVMSADLKLGIGCVTAHAQVGFSGGGKIILPGVAHIDSIAHYHIQVGGGSPKTTGLGRFDENEMRFDIEEAAEMTGLDFKVDVVVNERCEATGVFAGRFRQAHARAVAEAKQIYAIDAPTKDKDLVIANAFCKPNEMSIALLVGMLALKDRRGTVAVIANAPEGQVIHYLVGRFGQEYGGRQYPIAMVPPHINLIIQAPHRDKTFGDWYFNPDDITWTTDWQGTLDILKSKHGPGSRVGIVPSATMAYYES